MSVPQSLYTHECAQRCSSCVLSNTTAQTRLWEEGGCLLHVSYGLLVFPPEGFHSVLGLVAQHMLHGSIP